MSGVTFKRQGRKDTARVLSFTSSHQRSSSKLTVKCVLKDGSTDDVVNKKVDILPKSWLSKPGVDVEKPPTLALTARNSMGLHIDTEKNSTVSTFRIYRTTQDEKLLNSTATGFGTTFSKTYRNPQDKSGN